MKLVNVLSKMNDIIIVTALGIKTSLRGIGGVAYMTKPINIFSDKYLTKSTHLKLISPLFFSYTFYIELL